MRCADRLDVVARQRRVVDHHLEAVVVGRVVAAGDHHAAAGAEVLGGEVRHRRGDHAEVDHVRAGTRAGRRSALRRARDRTVARRGRWRTCRVRAPAQREPRACPTARTTSGVSVLPTMPRMSYALKISRGRFMRVIFSRLPRADSALCAPSKKRSTRSGSQSMRPRPGPVMKPTWPPCGGCSRTTSGETSSCDGSDAAGHERIVARVDDERRNAHLREPRLRRRARPVVVRAGESVQRRRHAVVELPHGPRARDAARIELAGKALRHRERLGMQRLQEMARVDAIEAAVDRDARRHEVEGHGRRCRRAQRVARRFARHGRSSSAGRFRRGIRRPRTSRRRTARGCARASLRLPRDRRSDRRAACDWARRRSRENAGSRRATCATRGGTSGCARNAIARRLRDRGTAPRAARRRRPARRASRSPRSRRRASRRARAAVPRPGRGRKYG